ncbi:Protein sidekick-2, partial [Armadillidium nasatum]
LGDEDSETLLPCQTYNIRLRASNEIGIGPAASLRVELDAEVPNAVSHLRCNPVDPQTVKLTWETQHTSCRIDYYQITLKGDILWDGTTSNSSFNVSDTSSNEGSVILDGLTAYTMHYITLEAGNDAGLGKATSCSCETEPDVPSEPTSLALVIGTLTESSFSVTWNDPTFKNGIMEILELVFRMEAENNAGMGNTAELAILTL